MIERLWRGWTAPEDADEYERLLREEIVPGFADEDVEGFRGVRVLGRPPSERNEAGPGEGEGDSDGEGEVEFVTAMQFDSLDAVREFAGDDYRQTHVPPEAREPLSRYDDRARHYEARESEAF